MEQQAKIPKGEFKRLFAELDLKGNGKIALWEITSYFSRLWNEKDAEEFGLYVMRNFDTDKNGTLNFKEFKEAMHAFKGMGLVESGSSSDED